MDNTRANKDGRRNLFDAIGAKRQRHDSSSSSSTDDGILEDDDQWQPPQNADTSSDESLSSENENDLPVVTETSERQPEESMGSKDGTIWSTKPPLTTKVQQHNIVRAIRKATQVDSQIEAMELFVNPGFLSIIVTNTNLEGERKSQGKTKKWVTTDDVEIKALIGALLALGSLSQSLLSLKTIMDEVWGNPFVRSLFSYNRLLDLLVTLRFDDKNSRSARREKGPLAPIRDLWDTFENELKKHYTPGHDLTIDEQLVPFRGRCKFRIYIPSKPDKYGLKIYWLCDAKTSYPLRGLSYLGKVGRTPEKDHGVNVVLSLVEPFHRSGRNITWDSFFTTLALAKSLLQKGMTCVGTVKKDKRFIPDELRHDTMKKKELNSNAFAFQDNSMLLTYKSKKTQMCNSSQHNAFDYKH